MSAADVALARVAVRRNRWSVPAWIAGTVLLFWSQAWGTDRLYDAETLAIAARTMGDNVAYVALAGPTRALDTVGGQVAWQASAYGAILAALMSAFLVAGATRGDEDEGRAELVGGTPAARDAAVRAALVVATGANVLLGLAVAAALALFGLPLAGSVALGTGTAACGIVFAAATALAAQVMASRRAALGSVGGVIALAFTLRALGDIGVTGLNWLSPIGWAQAQRPYADERWWPLLLPLAGSAILVVAADRVQRHRDLGTGTWTRRDHRSAPRRLTGLPALARQQRRAAVAWWAVGIGAAGLVYGAIGADDVDELLGDSELSRTLFGTGGPDPFDAYLSTAVSMLMLLVTAGVLSALSGLRAAESDHQLDLLLSTPRSRRDLLVAHGVVAVLAVGALAGAGGLGLAAGQVMIDGPTDRAAELLVAPWAQAPGVLLVASILMLGWALHRRGVVAGWAALAVATAVLLVGRALDLPAWVLHLSVFEWLPVPPAASVAGGAVAFQSVLALAVAGLACLLVDRRDLD